ncbi:hypothetical protein CBM2585_B20289 [Cupriavidus taiwanensis]|nr:hypothetical protein CBM2585_B20289 [Cupriavidus taiwanensis]
MHRTAPASPRSRAVRRALVRRANGRRAGRLARTRASSDSYIDISPCPEGCPHPLFYAER